MIDIVFFLQDSHTYCMQVASLFHHAEPSPFCNWYHLFKFSFLSKQNKHARNTVSFYFFSFICGRAKCSSRKQYVTALCSSCSLSKYLERWPAALYETKRSVLMLMKGSNIPRIELNTVNLYQHYSLFMPNKILYTWRGDYCECVRPAQLPVLTEVRAPSILEPYPRYVPHRERAGYNTVLSMCPDSWGTVHSFVLSMCPEWWSTAHSSMLSMCPEWWGTVHNSMLSMCQNYWGTVHISVLSMCPEWWGTVHISVLRFCSE